MKLAQFIAIAPELILSLAIVMQLLLIALKRSQHGIAFFTMSAILLALFAHYPAMTQVNSAVTPLIYVDVFSLTLKVLILSCTLVAVWVSYGYLRSAVEFHDEYYVLLLLAVLGANILVLANHFAAVFLGFELLSLSLVGMIGYLHLRQHTLEAGFKYLILSATASSIMLLGMAFVYGATGELSLAYQVPGQQNLRLLGQAGLVLIMVGFSFKLSLVPFHTWTPDVYQGAPMPVTLLLATVSKAAMFAILVKFWLVSAIFNNETLQVLLLSIAIASMLLGNLLALTQKNIKRLLAYSSIAHMGYLIIVLAIQSQQSVAWALKSGVFYILVYILATLILMIYLAGRSKAHGVHDQDDWRDWQGMIWRRPAHGACLILALLSLAGIPLTAGFIGKFYLFTVAIENQLWGAIAALIIGSGIGLYYYLSIIFCILAKPPVTQCQTVAVSGGSFTISHTTVMAMLTVIIIALGVFPDILASQLMFQSEQIPIIFNEAALKSEW
ncbi:NADH-quinone oxidoreductase subunit N [Thalassotalea mangrovi]|uniref:NADH-quinone oxidoreductase subunit N n=1 Tax=Thalassotalea mangrovi TaxID=2572245 RepID=A0A4U1B1Z5_9GAMM|nr:NADH-quinone oxidoreductase subunit N [Thalassotalea mangrovi]TKB43427.1 NADH-quinone oxidoreductase subunit N [Thalassotalea mangrovi]